MIAIIDYDAGNIKSVEKALRYLGQEATVTGDYREILHADRVILPGVGSFGDAMRHLKQRELDRAIRDVAARGIPFLGICLGLQLLFESSEESPDAEGLGLLPGRILRIPQKQGLKIPHIGWNSLDLCAQGRLFHHIPQGAYVYFVHSYYLQAEEEAVVRATTEYGVRIHASVEKGNIFACQFHPEKSGGIGLEILKNFVAV